MATFELVDAIQLITLTGSINKAKEAFFLLKGLPYDQHVDGQPLAETIYRHDLQKAYDNGEMIQVYAKHTNRYDSKTELTLEVNNKGEYNYADIRDFGQCIKSGSLREVEDTENGPVHVRELVLSILKERETGCTLKRQLLLDSLIQA